MKRKSAGFVMTSVLLDPKIRKEFEALLPRDKTMADAIREYMKEVVDEQKKEEAPDRIPILGDLSTKEVYNKPQLTLYSFMDTVPEDIETLGNDRLEDFSKHCLLMRMESIRVRNKRLAIKGDARGWHIKV